MFWIICFNHVHFFLCLYRYSLKSTCNLPTYCKIQLQIPSFLFQDYRFFKYQSYQSSCRFHRNEFNINTGKLNLSWDHLFYRYTIQSYLLLNNLICHLFEWTVPCSPLKIHGLMFFFHNLLYFPGVQDFCL